MKWIHLTLANCLYLLHVKYGKERVKFTLTFADDNSLTFDMSAREFTVLVDGLKNLQASSEFRINIETLEEHSYE